MSAECGMRSAESRPVKTLVCFAMKEEAGAFKKIAGDRPDISILITGIGRKNTENSFRVFLEINSPQTVFTCGFAGGLNPDLQTGMAVFATDDAGSREKLIATGARAARFECASRIATTASEKAELRSRTGADAVEMESEVIQNICRERGIPCATVRIILDTAQENLPLDFNELSNADLTLNYGKLALAIAKSPGKVSALMRLQKNCRLAAERLAAVLNQVIGPK